MTLNKRIVTRSPKPLTEAQRIADWKRQQAAESSARKSLEAFRAKRRELEIEAKAANSQFLKVLAMAFVLIFGLLIGALAFAAGTFEYGRTCMALAIYAEARSEGYDGQAAVGKVILNRVRSGMASSICDAVQAYGQFKGIADWPYPRVPHEHAAWAMAQRVTEDVITERYILAPENCENALYFRSGDAPLPINATKECKIGNHRFFQLAPR